ncbi:major facilitator superfamily domain-containing protein [Xylaria nigripes]|nr:major facilitator superfamily domain-containing protein [Xylaria nigripes]
MAGELESSSLRRPWRAIFRSKNDETLDHAGISGMPSKPTWTMGILNDRETIEVPGSVLLLPGERNEPLGLRNTPARTSHSSLPIGILLEPAVPPPAAEKEGKKMTKNGQIILEPQPDDSHNDPLNWPAWRRDSALLSLGLFCMVGGGITPIMAAGFTNVADDFDIDITRVPLTTGLFMMGLGIGSVIFSPTAILYGKRFVYLFGSVLFILSTVWCALSPNFTSLVIARIFQGISVSPVECLPSATIAEIFFLHERAFRIGIYTLLLLGGKNLVPLVSAVIIDVLGWRWVFWVVAIVVAFCALLLFFFVPETFWDRTPIPPKSTRRSVSRSGIFSHRSSAKHAVPQVSHDSTDVDHNEEEKGVTNMVDRRHVGFAPGVEDHPASKTRRDESPRRTSIGSVHEATSPSPDEKLASLTSTTEKAGTKPEQSLDCPRPHMSQSPSSAVNPEGPHNVSLSVPETDNYKSAVKMGLSTVDDFQDPEAKHTSHGVTSDTESERISFSTIALATGGQAYTHRLRQAPRQSFRSQLKVYNGRLNQDKWLKVAIRPFVLCSYPAVLWSSAVYACSIGWLIVISECVDVIFRQSAYKFSALSTGLVYISPFIGGVLGSGVAGKFSDVIVQAMARRNGGLYEPEFRLVMVIPIAIATGLGLIGFGWSAEIDDPWIVPTVFFGIISFGCSLGSTTAITYCVDSYRQYAGEALVTLNFIKNILHGLVFSLFVTGWLKADGSKTVFVWIGVIQLVVLLSTIPMYIYGKRARMWTVRMNFMEKF